MSDAAAPASASAAPVPAATSPVTVDATPKEILKGSEEADIILKVYHPTVSANEQWAILDAKWYNGWARYSGMGEDRKGKPAEETGAPRPGPVDNKEIQSAVHPGMLKQDLVEARDYVLVHVDVWAKYMEWYGGGPAFIRGTITEGLSKIVRVEMYPIFLHLHEVKGDVADEATATFKSVSGRLTVKEVINQLLTADEKKAIDEAKEKKDLPIRIWMHEEPVEDKKATAAPAVAVAAPGGAVVPAADATATPAADAAATPAATAAPAEGAAAPAPAPAAAVDPAAPAPVVRKKDNWRLVEGEYTLNTSLEGLGVSRFAPIKVLVERQNTDGTWPRAAYVKDWKDFEIGDIIDVQDTVGKWYESKIRDIKPDQIHTHFIGWADSWDEWLPKTSARLAKKNTHTTGPRVKPAESSWGGMSWSYGASDDGRPTVPGAVGLRNLGNTCFMNSTLACLSHSPVFTDYFLDNKHDKEINRDNPLGWKGKVAEEYAGMTKEVWSDKFTTVAPKKFKDAIGQFAPRFSGYQQQDSSELLSFLLDGLHEDLNRVLKKPATSAIESKGRPDPVVADESWANYKLRNDSMIVDIVQGQLKSRLQCPDTKCNRISITFDPFTFLSAPMPTIVDKLQQINVVFCTPGKQVTIFGTTVPTVGRFSDLRKATAEVSGVPAKRLVFAELWNHRVHRFLGDDAGLSELRPGDHIYAYECPELDDCKDAWIPIEVYHQRVERNPAFDPSYAHSREFLAGPFGCPRAIAVPRKSTLSSKQLRALIDTCAGPAKPVAGGSPFKIIALQNDGRTCLKCGYTSNCTGCEAPDDDVPMDIGDKYNSKIVFALQWPDTSLYNDAPDQMIRDPSATVALQRREASVDLGDCLRAFTKQETLSAEDPWYCSDCKEFRQAYKKFDIWRLPQLLIIHLKRFSYTSTYRDKISTFVDFPVDGLDMSQYCPNEEYKGDKGLYDLYGVSNHMGSMGGGHYTAYVRNMTNDKWYCHDDSRVSPVNVSEIKSTSAYVLFYKRRDLPKSRRHESLAAATPAADTAATAAAGAAAPAAAAAAPASGASTPAPSS